MPRAFLITNRRYNTFVEYGTSDDEACISKEASPERTVCTAEQSFFVGEHGYTTATSPKTSSALALLLECKQEFPEQQQPHQEAFMTALFSSNGVSSATRLPFKKSQNKLSKYNENQSELDYNFNEIPRSLKDDWDEICFTDTHICPECGKQYSTSSNLARHRQTHRSVTDKKARKCPHCDKVYVSMPAFSMHVRTHNQGCQCPYCGKCFSRPWLLQGHIRTHTGEKPFKCPICAKAFADKSNLRAHIQTHSNTKPYVCQRCGKAFALKSYLYKHEESSCMRLHKQDKQR